MLGSGRARGLTAGARCWLEGREGRECGVYRGEKGELSVSSKTNLWANDRVRACVK